jgi:hypothetical protein
VDVWQAIENRDHSAQVGVFRIKHLSMQYKHGKVVVERLEYGRSFGMHGNTVILRYKSV